MKFYSHPKKLLTNHLIEVRDTNLEEIPIELREAVNIVALCHDFGKYTSFFQRYLIDHRPNNLSNHGFISAIFGAFVAFKRLEEDSFLPLIIYNVILHHHGNLERFDENLPRRKKNITRMDFPLKLVMKYDIGIEQIEDFKKNKKFICKDLEKVKLDKEFLMFLSTENIILLTLQRLKILASKLLRGKEESKYYFLHQYIYSILISADKKSASGIKYEGPIYAGLKELKKIRDKKFKGPVKGINVIREEIFNKVLRGVKNNYNKSNIFSITSPTGTGKTFTGFYSALLLKDILGLNGKIIYTLPFTSIIEQNYIEIKKLYEELEDYCINGNRYLLKHHSLSKTDYVSGEHDYTSTEAELLIENWESGIIITTFVQVFETIIGSRNRMLKKFISFKDSVILIDEIQSIDIEYYTLIDYVLNKLCEYMNCKIILMTATKPMILEKSEELLSDNAKYFKVFNRTKLIPNLNNISIDKFINKFIESLEEKSYLIVCNTIKQSLDIYNLLQNENIDQDIYYLSTNILPFDRINRVKEIQEKLHKDEKLILVSTQVVEAGVDLDFDEVIRDLAPLDSIIQCAGRCNRNSKKDIGSVKVVNMLNNKEEPFGKYVYGNTLLNLTKDLLSSYEYIEEKDYFNLIDIYFKGITEYKSNQKSLDLIDSINKLNFTIEDVGINTFSLIKNNPSYIDVLFVYNDLVEEKYEEYKKIYKIADYNKKREKYLEIGQVFKNFTLSIPIKYKNIFTEENGMLIMPRDGVSQYYYEDTGFHRDFDNDLLLF